jgi:hypothetical protein
LLAPSVAPPAAVPSPRVLPNKLEAPPPVEKPAIGVVSFLSPVIVEVYCANMLLGGFYSSEEAGFVYGS